MVTIDDQHVTVAAARGAALDRRIAGNRIGPGVTLVGIIEGDADDRRTARHDYVRNAEGAAEVIGAEVRMERGGEADARDQSVRIRIHRLLIDRHVPRVVVRKEAPAVQARARAQPFGILRVGGGKGARRQASQNQEQASHDREDGLPRRAGM